MRKVVKKGFGSHIKSISNVRKVETNLEKRTQEKITAMSNESLTMDFVLKNRKLLEHLKKCKVFLSKSMRNNLLKKYGVADNATKKNNFGKIKSRKKVLSQNDKSTKVRQQDLSPSTPHLRAKRVTNTSETPKSTQSPKTKLQKLSSLPPGRNGQSQSAGRIFIRLPSKFNKRTLPKRPITGGVLNKSKLIRKFGKLLFKCHVRVKRLKKSDPLFTKKFSINRKSVSFMETVEVFGESDVIYESDESDDLDDSISPARTSTPVKQLKKQNKKMHVKKTKIATKKTVKSSVKDQKLKKKSLDKKKQQKNKETSKKVESPSRKIQKKPRSPVKHSKQTGLNLTRKECFVKLNRSSTSILNLSSTSDGNQDAKNTSENNSIEVTGADNLTAKESEVNSSGEKTDTNDPEENPTVGAKMGEESIRHHEDSARSDAVESELGDGEHLSLSIESALFDRPKISDTQSDEVDDNKLKRNKTDNVYSDDEGNGNVNNENTDNGGESSSKDQNDAEDNIDDDGGASNDQSGDAPKADKGELTNSPSPQKSVDKVNGKKSTDVGDSFHSTNDVNTSGDISESRVSTPVRKSESFETIEQKKRRAVSMSPILTKSNTNGTNKKKSSPMTKPADPDDLFDMLKSDKLPDKPESERRIPSPTRGLSDDEDEGDDAVDKKRTAPSPVPDLLDDSGSANDTRFSLNTFFKSMKDKFLTKQSANESPGKSPEHNDANAINNAEDLDSTAQEITTQ